MRCLGRSLTRARAGKLGRDQAPVDLCLHPAHPLCVLVAETETDAAMAVTHTDDAGGMMHAVDDHIAGLSHRAAGDDGDAVENLPAEGFAGFHQRVVGGGESPSHGRPDVDTQQEASPALRLGDSIGQDRSDARVEYVDFAGEALCEALSEPQPYV